MIFIRVPAGNIPYRLASTNSTACASSLNLEHPTAAVDSGPGLVGREQRHGRRKRAIVKAQELEVQLTLSGPGITAHA